MDNLPRNSRVARRSWWRGLPAIALMIGVCAAAGAAQPSDDREVALAIIPPPKLLSLRGSMLPLVPKGKPPVVVVTPQDPDQKETLAAPWIATELAALGGKTPEVVAGPTGIESSGNSADPRLVLATFDRKTETLGRIARLLDEADRELLGDAGRCEQAYVIRCENNLIAVVGGSPQGTYANPLWYPFPGFVGH